MITGPLTIEDWLELDPAPDGSSIELLNGHLLRTPPPDGGHQFVTGNLAMRIDEAIRTSGRTDLSVVHGVGVRISTATRTALIPDVVILNRKPFDDTFPAEAVWVAAEVWASSDTPAEREAKEASYALAGVPFFWTVDQPKPLRLIAHRLENGLYKAENILETEGPHTITAAPVPIALDLADLIR
ncbi:MULTISPECIES: Uma2 family endonuclease [unclassified Saccharothrix]|uniref:Uma2 family endonuclease n=1 Tax=unclassified Saccharothrix TaxID=2593673 RepID=UPI00307EE4B4